MKKIGIFYGSSSGGAQAIAKRIGLALHVDAKDIFDISRAPIEKVLDYDVLILGTSTWGSGDLQSDWEDVVSKFEKHDLTGKKVAIFGTGDSQSYSDTFCEGMGLLSQSVQKTGAELIGNKVSASDYSFDASLANIDGYFCGLAIDDDNEPEKTPERVAAWILELQKEL